ncbi:MAG: shikimate kinase [Bacteroidales bacterium]|nr:shikimate kinase [Bacteroidales bacterium]
MKKRSSLAIMGFMGSGKSTLGRELARVWDYEFIDLDHYLVTKTGLTIPRIFELSGESGFREKERKVLIEVLNNHDKTIIALGGGTPCYSDNMQIIKSHSKTLYLKLSANELSTRLSHSPNPRPLIKGKTLPELNQYILNELTEREEYYNQADITIESDNIIIGDLLAFLSNPPA